MKLEDLFVGLEACDIFIGCQILRISWDYFGKKKKTININKTRNTFRERPFIPMAWPGQYLAGPFLNSTDHR